MSKTTTTITIATRTAVEGICEELRKDINGRRGTVLIDAEGRIQQKESRRATKELLIRPEDIARQSGILPNPVDWRDAYLKQNALDAFAEDVIQRTDDHTVSVPIADGTESISVRLVAM